MDLAPEIPFRICRFPVPDDDGLCLTAQDGYFQIGRRGGERLNEVQWYTHQITVPVLINGDSGNAGELLRLLDIVDAPGADAQGQGDFPRWKQRKNSYVFQLSAREIDVLLVCCSAETAAVQVGGQFQNNVWQPFVDRVQGQTSGRLLLAFSHSAEFLADAEQVLRESAPGDSVNSRTRSTKTFYKP